MRYDGLVEAISEGEPCGPDLDEIGDNAYLNYMLPAADRLPARFYDKNTGAAFDRSTIDIRSEVKAISSLLERSRDLRLLALEARFQCLAGQVTGFCECLQAMAALVDKRWDDVHPRSVDGDHILRQNTFGALDDRTTIILPLQYAPVATDKKIGNISLRDYLAALGQVQVSAQEKKAEVAGITEIIQQEGNRAGAVAMHASLLGSEQALTTIRNRFVESAGYEYVPDFAGLQEVFGQMRAMFEAALPELVPAEVQVAEASDANGAGPAADGAAGMPAAAPLEFSAIAPVPIGSHAEATAALLAVEQYFVGTEPSSPALILVHQARMLVGIPLVSALEILMPESAEKALISFDAGVRFQLAMPRMKSISDAVTSQAPAATNGAGKHASFVASTRPEAQGLLYGVDAFFRATEPSSPIPMLLAKAKTYLNRDFAAILADLIKADSGKPAT